MQVTGLSFSPARTHHLAVLGAGHAGVQGRPETPQVPLPGHTWALPSWSLKLLILFTFVFSLVSVQFSSVAQLCLTLCNPMNHSTPGLPVHHQLPEFTQTHVHRVGDAIQPSHPLSSPFSSCLQSLPASGSFPMSQLFT